VWTGHQEILSALNPLREFADAAYCARLDAIGVDERKVAT